MTEKWRRIDDAPLQCHCGAVLRVMPIHCRCGRRYDLNGGLYWSPFKDDDAPKRISAKTKVLRYAEALAKWVKAGRPTRSDEEVEQIYVICAGDENQDACEFFQDDTCQKCGCVIRKKPAAFLNKLKMATESCPVDKWKATVTEED